jgi:ribonuclease HII
VIAKVARDRLMVELAGSYPWYGWHANKGYAAPEHRAALLEKGPCEEHRRSWHLLVSDEEAVLEDPDLEDPDLEDPDLRTAAGCADPGASEVRARRARRLRPAGTRG